LFATLVVWGAFSALWSIDPGRSLIIAARLAALAATGLALVSATDRLRAPERLNLLLLTGLALGVAAAAADLVTGGAVGAPFTDRAYQAAALNRASVSFAIALLPAAAVLLCRGQKLLGLAIGATTGTVIGALAGTAAKAALLAALPAGLFLYLSRARFARAAAVISVLIILTAPLTFAKLAQLPLLPHSADAVKSSGGHRLFIWSFAGDRTAERPLIGWGLDASRAMPGGSDPIRPGQTWLPLHPHNAPLQLWLELGVPGVAIFALLSALAWVALAEMDRHHLFAAAAGGIAILTISIIRPTFLPFLGSVCVFLLGMGIVNPLGTAHALSPFGQRAGAASALLGFWQMMGAALGVFLTANISNDAAFSLGIVLIASSILALGIYTKRAKPA